MIRMRLRPELASLRTKLAVVLARSAAVDVANGALGIRGLLLEFIREALSNTMPVRSD